MVRLSIRKDVALDVSFEEIVGGLKSAERTGRPKSIHLGRRKITNADRTDFALPLEARKGGRGFLDGHAFVRPVHLIKIDDIGLQPEQRVFQLRAQTFWRRISKNFPIPPFKTNLGGNNRIGAAASFESLASNLLRATEAVDRSRVDHVYAGS